ncbi:hypothetical protein WKW79_35045, partial [Variovorax robiniae]
NTMRTARSMTSGENFGDFLILAPFSIEGASSKAGAVQSASVPSHLTSSKFARKLPFTTQHLANSAPVKSENFSQNQ